MTLFQLKCVYTHTHTHTRQMR